VDVDLLIRDANVITIDRDRPRASVVAVSGGRIVAVGDDDLADLPAGRVVDLGGLTVVPGFNDAHQHMAHHGAALAQVALSSPPIRTVEEILDRIAERVDATPPGEWVIGAGYDQNKLVEQRHPTAAELDRVAPDHPVLLGHNSGHMCVVNGAAMRLARIGDRPVPDGGRVVVDDEGRPTGLLQEQAQELVRELIKPSSITAVVEALGLASDQYLSEGVTSCQEAGVGCGSVGQTPIELAAYQEARAAGRLRVRVTTMVAQENLHEIGHHAADPGGRHIDLGIRTGFGDEWLRVGPTKVFADGSLIGRTAAMFEPFEGGDDAGLFQIDPAELAEIITGAHLAGWQVATHAIGDRAVSTVLDIYEACLRDHPRADARHRVEHAGVTRSGDVARMASLGVIPVPQARFISEIGDGMKAALGPARTRDCYRQRSFLDAGLRLPGSSDRPVVQGAPLLGIHDLVNQRTEAGEPFNPHEALTPEQALEAYTLGSAYAAFDEDRKGSVTPGKLADLVVLGDDPTTIDRAGIAEIQVLATMVGGTFVHEAVGALG
jgi:predicted amidohydrolase YtcJ